MLRSKLLLAASIVLLAFGTWHASAVHRWGSTGWMQRVAVTRLFQVSLPPLQAHESALGASPRGLQQPHLDAAASRHAMQQQEGPLDVVSSLVPPPVSPTGSPPADAAAVDAAKVCAASAAPHDTPGAPPAAALEPPAAVPPATSIPPAPAAPPPAPRRKRVKSNATQPSCVLQGTVDETSNCTYEAVTMLNQHDLHPILSQLVKTAFFRYFKVNIHCDCPLWPDDSMCALSSCSVCECEPMEVPQPWITEEMRSCAVGAEREAATEQFCNTPQCIADTESLVDSRVEPSISKALHSLKGWRGLNNPWMASGEDDEQYLYINLLVNPERYTGYKGPHAHRIWNAVYSQSCFNGPDCTEKRVFYRLISGVHSSISAHIAGLYLLSEEDSSVASRAFGGSPFGAPAPAAVWGPSLRQFKERLGTPAVRDRVENLYFAYLFVLRAVMKIAPLLETYGYDTGLPEEDATTTRLARELASRRELHAACPVPFDEGRLWKGEQGPLLLGQLQRSFQNITRIMDCVGCEKCKLWGKLQTLGIATALKILFSSADCGGVIPPAAAPLERNELIALINVLARFSSSLEIYRTMSQQLTSRTGAAPTVDMEWSVA